MRRARAGRTTVGSSALLSERRVSLSHLWESCKGRVRMYYAYETARLGGWGQRGRRGQGQYGESKKLVAKGRKGRWVDQLNTHTITLREHPGTPSQTIADHSYHSATAAASRGEQ